MIIYEIFVHSFYRYVLEPEVKYTVDSSSVAGQGAYFHNVPHKPLLTLNMEPPESWLVESVKAVYDLDNIYLEEVNSEIQCNSPSTSASS